MALDRDSIVRKDFPIANRGYDPAAVDAHLSAIGHQIEELEHAPSCREGDSVAGAVSEQVRRIVEAAENSAAEILSQAELEAREIRAQASRATERAKGDAERMREEAAVQARTFVGRLSNAVSQLLGRLEAIDGDLNALTSSLRADTERLRGELTTLEVFERALNPGAAAPQPPTTATDPWPAAEYSTESAKLGDEPFEDTSAAGADASAGRPPSPAKAGAPVSDEREGA